MIPTADVAELRTEKAALLKADTDIEEGRRRLRNQEDIVRELLAGGHDIRQAERLVDILKDTLVQWERHRILIEQRVAYLQTKV
jgi:hypothetical protein